MYKPFDKNKPYKVVSIYADVDSEIVNAKIIDDQYKRPIYSSTGQYIGYEPCFVVKYSFGSKSLGAEFTEYFSYDGYCPLNKSMKLVNIPEKKSGWINLYRRREPDGFGFNVVKGEKIFPSREAALSVATKDTIVDTIYINWEE